MAEIDSLEVKIDVNPQKAVKGIESVISTLDKLKKATLGNLTSMTIPKGVSDEISKLNKSLSKLSTKNIDKLAKLQNTLNSFNGGDNKLGTGNSNALAKIGASTMFGVSAILQSLKGATSGIKNVVTESMNYTEDLNLFTASLGKYAEEAMKYGKTVSDVMGIDPGQWLRAQGIFQTIIEGFGVASNRAYIMSKNLTQLSYDISSFANIPVEAAIEKLTSGISGELEPLRRLGFDLSMARLKQEAYALGINKTFNEMTQAEKSQLRYIAIMKQVTVAQGDMARTLDTPANQMRIFSAMTVQAGRAIGDIFIPMLNAILPYAIAAMKAIRALASTIASFFGFKLPKIDYSGITKGAAAVGGIGDKADKAGKKLKGAGDAAKKLKNNLLGIDELNIISPDTPKSGSGGAGGGAGGGGAVDGFDFDLPQYDFLKGLTDSKVSEAMRKMTEWAKKLTPAIALLGSALAGLELAKFIAGLMGVKDVLGALTLADWAMSVGGAMLFLGGAFLYVQNAIDAIFNGMNWKNLVGMLVGMAGMIGGIYLAIKPLSSTLAPIAAGFTAAATGLGLFVIALRDARIHGVNVVNLLGSGVGLVALVGGLAIACKDLELVIGGINIAPFIAPLAGIIASLEMVKTGIVDIVLNGVNVNNFLLVFGGLLAATVLAVNALTAAMDINPLFAIGMGIAIVIGGIASVIHDTTARLEEVGAASYKSTDDFKTMTQSIKDSQNAMDEAKHSCEDLEEKMRTLNEVQVDNATVQKLVDDIMTLNEKTELTAENISEIKWKTSLLSEITNGKVNLEFDETTGHIKQTREQVEQLVESYKKEAEQKALQEVLTESYKNRFKAIQNIQIEQKKYNEELEKVKGLSAELDKTPKFVDPVKWGEVNAKLEEHKKALESSGEALKQNVQLYEDSTFAIENSGNALTELGVKGSEAFDKITTIPKDIDIDVSDLKTQLETKGGEVSNGLYEGIKRGLAVASFTPAFAVIGKKFAEDYELQPMSKVFMRHGGNITEGLSNGIKSGVDSVVSTISNLADSAIKGFKNIINGDVFKGFGNDTTNGFSLGVSSGSPNAVSVVSTWASEIKNKFNGGDGVNSVTFGKYALDIVTGFKDKVQTTYTNAKQAITTWATGVKDWFVKDGGASKPTFEGYAKDIVEGFKAKVDSLKSTVKTAMTSFAEFVKTSFASPNGKSLKSSFEEIAQDVMKGFKSGLEKAKEFVGGAVDRVTSFVTRRTRKNFDSHSPSRVFIGIGEDVMAGLRVGIDAGTPEVLGAIDTMSEDVRKAQPKLEYQVDTSKVKFSDNNSFMGVKSDTSYTKQTEIAVSGFKEGMVEFYKEYLEPTMREMATDVKRQANKKEETVVQIGNRTVHDVVMEQKNANGYSFISER